MSKVITFLLFYLGRTLTSYYFHAIGAILFPSSDSFHALFPFEVIRQDWPTSSNIIDLVSSEFSKKLSWCYLLEFFEYAKNKATEAFSLQYRRASIFRLRGGRYGKRT